MAELLKGKPVVESMALDLTARIDALGLADPFSKREREVVALVLRGNNVPAIARKLYISENTTRDHMKSIYRKASIPARNSSTSSSESRACRATP